MLVHELDAWRFQVGEHKLCMTTMMHVMNRGMMRNLVARAFHSWDLYNSEARQVQKDNVVALRSELQKADKKHHETRATKAQLLLKCGPKVGRSRPYSILRITFETLPGFHEASCFGK